MSAKSIAAYQAHLAAKGRPIAPVIDITQHAAKVAATKARRDAQKVKR
jgi:hypothetical protein